MALSNEQIARYGRFPEKLSVGDLEQCFRLTPDALALASSKRTPATRLGWAVQWGTVRMLGVFQPGPSHQRSRAGGGLRRRPARHRPRAPARGPIPGENRLRGPVLPNARQQDK
ncbi:DUF4158 domain-containing protein [Nocardiopsis sp. EMB25]|uniref:DUF4158 domain-containing protein n=1 Tax=Nocardiopsis sp. EMB25 TaxID=2835867 RepID=UPI003FA3ACD0